MSIYAQFTCYDKVKPKQTNLIRKPWKRVRFHICLNFAKVETAKIKLGKHKNSCTQPKNKSENNGLKDWNNSNISFKKVSEILFDQVITQPLNDHVTLSWSHWFFIQTKHHWLSCLLDCDSSSPLHKFLIRIPQISIVNNGFEFEN